MPHASILPRSHGAFSTAKAFRRSTGAHAILVWLLLADVTGFLFWLLAGALLTLPVWWLLRVLLFWLHASVVVDVDLVLLLACLALGLLRQHVQKKSEEKAWAFPSTFLVLLITALVLIWLLKPSWMAIPAPVPALTLEPMPHWPPPVSLLGGEIAAGLYLLAHLLLWRQMRQQDERHLLLFSRAHQEGSLWTLLERAYGFYRRDLARFAQPPLRQLKIPPTFFFFSRGPHTEEETPAHPEREVYWLRGELVICQAYLSPKEEQAKVWLPLVARLLHDCNSPVALVEQLLCLVQLARTSRWRVFLWLPLLVADSCERRWHALERDRVLDRDRFAWYCGEGGRLRELLRRRLGALHQMGQPDHTLPTLAERLDHLDSLLKQEARQVKALRAALPQLCLLPHPRSRSSSSLLL